MLVVTSPAPPNSTRIEHRHLLNRPPGRRGRGRCSAPARELPCALDRPIGPLGHSGWTLVSPCPSRPPKQRAGGEHRGYAATESPVPPHQVRGRALNKAKPLTPGPSPHPSTGTERACRCPRGYLLLHPRLSARPPPSCRASVAPCTGLGLPGTAPPSPTPSAPTATCHTGRGTRGVLSVY